jgi:D-glycero-D-manno-heptose 1,7-bisphosphate phosphatase
VTRAAVFLDRDGVLNRAEVRDGTPRAPETVDELEILPGVPEALARLRAAGYALVVVTNQPDVARGKVTRESVEAIHRRMAETLPLDAFYVCYHDDADRCACRKPRPGMLVEAANARGLDLAKSFMVGDRWRDIEAGVAAGCRTIFVDHGYVERRPDRFDFRADSLASAAEWILGEDRT